MHNTAFNHGGSGVRLADVHNASKPVGNKRGTVLVKASVKR
mgnify:FL=1